MQTHWRSILRWDVQNETICLSDTSKYPLKVYNVSKISRVHQINQMILENDIRRSVYQAKPINFPNRYEWIFS